MKKKYKLILSKEYIKIPIPFTKFKIKIPCGYGLDNEDNILNRGTLVDSLLAEGYVSGQRFELLVKSKEIKNVR